VIEDIIMVGFLKRDKRNEREKVEKRRANENRGGKGWVFQF